MNPEELITEYVQNKLKGNKDLLATFPLASLQYDKTFGCPNRRFDCDDTELMRAIYCIVFKDVWMNLSLENSGDGKLRGDTINSSATFFSYPWDNKFIPKWNPPAELIEKIDGFQKTFHTIGNMVVLPDRRIGEWSINKHRGCHDEWHDYEDRFLSALYKILTDKADKDEDLLELVTLNNEDFAPFYGEEGWKRFIDGNMLNNYVDKNYLPLVKSKGYTWWRGGYVNKDRYFAEAVRYIDDSTMIIEKRGQRMIEVLRQILSVHA